MHARSQIGAAWPLVLLLPLLVGCGHDDEPVESPTLLERRVLEADLMRGVTLALYGDGRAEVNLMHLGGGTLGLGTWEWDDGSLRVSIPRMQEHVTSGFKPVEPCLPPAVLVLRPTPEGEWKEVRRTFADYDERSLVWTERFTDHIPVRNVDRSYRFWTEADYERIERVRFARTDTSK